MYIYRYIYTYIPICIPIYTVVTYCQQYMSDHSDAFNVNN